MNNDNGPSRPEKKQKVDHVNDESSTWNIETQEDICETVRQYLKATITHDFCLEKYHIIKCGYSIKCDPSFPDILWTYFKNETYTISTPFQTYGQYTASVLGVMTKKNKYKAIEKAVKFFEATEETSDMNQKIVEEFIYIYRRANSYGQPSINKLS